MRFKLILDVHKQAFGDLLPINYQYESSCAIYRILAQASSDYSYWLHENGFTFNDGKQFKQFKLFCFSRLKIEKRQILPKEGRIKILSDTVEWQISFLPEKSTEKFIQGLFANQIFEIGDKNAVVQFQVRNVEVLPPPQYKEEMEFSTMSPICLRCRQEDGSTKYLSPSDERASDAILTGLVSRYEAFSGKSFNQTDDFKFTVLNEPKSVLVKLKANTPEQTRVRGYMCRFRMKAPVELMKMMYEGGVGQETSQGFGCIKISNN